MTPESFPLSHPIGRGRSASVYADVDEHGMPIARKVFVPDTASRIVMAVVEGAPNPYGWNEDAMRAAVSRRRILRRLVRYWFGERLRVPAQHGWRWNERHRALEMRNAFVEGRPVPLRHAPPPGPDLLAELTRRVMTPLQDRLEAAGFDGLVWQAGRGNPVATSNFLLEGVVDGDPRWAWIDLESGVPALFSPSPTAQLCFYLPRSLRYRPMFDDVDVPRLERYLDAHAGGIDAACGEGATTACLDEADALGEHQRRWKSMRRIERSIAYARRRGHLDAGAARYYRTRPLRWNLRVARLGAGAVARRVVRTTRNTLRWLAHVSYGRLVLGAGRFLVSQRYRTHVAHRLVRQRIRRWRRRSALDAAEAAALRARLGADESSQYVTDFGVHLAIKPIVKVLQWWLAPALFAVGVINGAVLAAILVAGGAIMRTLYTLGRIAQASVRGERRPWIALGVGVLPVAGNAAYPIELIYCGVGEGRALARFLVYDVFAAVGRGIPIWGGSDTLTEHWFNRLPDALPGLRPREAPPE